ncbi:MAG: GatB/YqeY domain-containing protein [Flavobacteriales bacterium]|nr:GatB/YqeY domain-containing protein [Flavobacteriales bacterium]
MSNLADSISAGIKDAMRAKDRDRLAALRDIKSKIMLEATKDGSGDVVDDATTLAILSKLLKQRNETAALYRDQGRPDLASEEEAQAAVIQEFLPAALTEAEIEAKVAEIVASTGASSMADMGKVMGLASSAMAGQADGKVISTFVRKALSS